MFFASECFYDIGSSRSTFNAWKGNRIYIYKRYIIYLFVGYPIKPNCSDKTPTSCMDNIHHHLYHLVVVEVSYDLIFIYLYIPYDGRKWRVLVWCSASHWYSIIYVCIYLRFQTKEFFIYFLSFFIQNFMI